MHSNLWNLKNSKERLQIMQRTEAHKRHLINILSIKSNLDNHNHPLKHRYLSNQHSKSKDREKENTNMLSRLTHLKQSPRNTNTQFRNLSKNLKTYSSLNRLIKHRQIQQQNSKIFSRLIMAQPTIKRKFWIKNNRQNLKYKQNIHRTKYAKPDYSQQAVKLIAQGPKFIQIALNNKNKHTGLLKKMHNLKK